LPLSIFGVGSIFQIERMVQAIGIQPRFCLSP